MATCNPSSPLRPGRACATDRAVPVVVLHSQADTLHTLLQVSLSDTPVQPGESCDLQPPLLGQQRSFAALLLAMWLIPAVTASRCTCVACQVKLAENLKQPETIGRDHYSLYEAVHCGRRP